MIKDAVDTDAPAQTALGQAVAAKLKKTNTQIDAVSAQMKAIAKKNRADIESLNKKTLAKIASEEVDAKFGAAYEKLASDRSHAEMALASSVNGLNDALAKQAALADSRFEKTVSDIQVARKEASDAVAELRSDFATELIATTALVKRVETNLADQVATVSGEVIDYRAFQLRVNRKVQKEKERIEELS